MIRSRSCVVALCALASLALLPSTSTARDDRGGTQARMADLPRRGEGEAKDSARRARPTTTATAVPKGSGRLEKKEDKVAGGTHWRIKTDAGAVHAWIPPGYDRATAGTVVYVHGYYTDSDGAWRDHDLARQFRASKQNALFIVPDAPSGNGEDVKWHALTDLRKAMTRANIRIPDGPTIVMGHSGAFRTVMKWVDHKVVAQVILLDALYGGAKSFDEFIGSGKRAKQHKLIVIGADTAEESRGFIKRYPFAVAREKMPASVDDFTKREKRAKLLYVHSQFGHMEIVRNGKVIPLLLRLTPLGAVGDKPADKAKPGDKKNTVEKVLWPFPISPEVPAPSTPQP